MSVHPFLSVIIPVHNSAATLMKSVRSVIGQDFDRPIEIILVENGSTDASPELCRQIAGENESVSWVSHSPAGLSEARNRGIRESKGEWVAFLDSDDYLSPDFFSALFSAQEAYDADMVYCNFVEEWDDGRTMSEFPNSGQTIFKTTPDAVTDILLDKATSAAWNRIYPRIFFDSHAFPEGVIFEDHTLMFKWVSDCHRVAYVDRPLYHYCHAGNGTITSDAFTSNAPKMRQFIEANLSRLKFADTYGALSTGERKAVLRHNLNNIIHFSKRYESILRSGSSYATASEIARAGELRTTLLSYLSPHYITKIGLKNLTRLCQIKWFMKRPVCSDIATQQMEDGAGKP